MKDGALEYYCNTLVSYALRGVHTTLNVIWDWEPPAGSGDTHFAFYRGTRARVEVRQGAADGYRPELYVVPATRTPSAAVLAAVSARLAAPAADVPGRRRRGSRRRDPHRDSGRVPGRPRGALRAGDGQLPRVSRRIVAALPAWERPNMLAKYYVTTTGAEMSRTGPSRTAPRLAK